MGREPIPRRRKGLRFARSRWGDMGPNLVSCADAMLCDDCRSRLNHARGSATPDGLALTEQYAQLRALICAGCGALLPHAGAFDIIVGKLAQLARFGLDPDGRPLLKATREDS